MNKQFWGVLAIAFFIQSCIEATPTSKTSKAPVITPTSKAPPTSSTQQTPTSEAPNTTTEAQPTTTGKIETTTQRFYDCSEGAGQYPSSYSCSQYYVCVQPYIPAYVFDCPANLWYDAKLKQCNYQQMVDCKIVNVKGAMNMTEDPNSMTKSTAATKNSTTSTEPITEVSTAPTNVTITTMEPETTTKKTYDCSEGAGQYPSPYSCSQYYVCVQPYIPAYVFDCPANLWYDAKLKQCNYQPLVDCHLIN